MRISDWSSDVCSSDLRQACFDAACDRLRLTALLGADAGIGAGRVDQGDDRQMKAVGQLHQTARLAIALGPRHSEVMGDAGVGIGALLMPDDDAGPAAEPAEATENRLEIGRAHV